MQIGRGSVLSLIEAKYSRLSECTKYRFAGGCGSVLILWANDVQDLMDHGIPFRRKVAEGGEK